MRFVIFAALLGTVLSVELPGPKLNKGSLGGLEISIDGTSGVSFKYIEYMVNGENHFGGFHKAVDGRWYHRNPKVRYDEGKLEYKITADVNGRVQTIEGAFVEAPQEFSALSGPIRRAGHTVLRDDFSGSSLNMANWKYEISAYGGYNGEFQVYTNDKVNVYLRDGHLFVRPTLTADKLGEHTLHSGTMNVAQLWGSCTQSGNSGCERHGTHIPPIMSGKLTSHQVIRYGRVEIRAKTPCGDWIWPALWMLPRSNHYGGWPKSGEIDIMESRGNEQALAGDGSNHGNNRVTSTLHWGTDGGHDRSYLTHGGTDGSFCRGFHTYVLDWTADHIRVTVDGHETLNVHTPAGGFWQKGHFSGYNIWSHGGQNAPFDHSFYFIINVAVGGTNGFFPSGYHYNSPMPWHSASTAKADFWSKKHDWYPSWKGEDAAMQIDYIEMNQY